MATALQYDFASATLDFKNALAAEALLHALLLALSLSHVKNTFGNGNVYLLTSKTIIGFGHIYNIIYIYYISHIYMHITHR